MKKTLTLLTATAITLETLASEHSMLASGAGASPVSSTLLTTTPASRLPDGSCGPSAELGLAYSCQCRPGTMPLRPFCLRFRSHVFPAPLYEARARPRFHRISKHGRRGGLSGDRASRCYAWTRRLLALGSFPLTQNAMVGFWLGLRKEDLQVGQEAG